METIKKTAERMVLYTSNHDATKTWDQQPSAPQGGFADRVGYILFDEVEAYTDVALSNDGMVLLNVRAARVVGEGEEERFYIVTLDFYADRSEVENLIAHKEVFSAPKFIELLHRGDTIPKLFHVSYNTGAEAAHDGTSVRYEYVADQIDRLSEQEQKAFLEAVDNTLEIIGVS